MLNKARSWFQKRKILEVDCCALVPRAPLDANIDVMSVNIGARHNRFLHTSPEISMKKLLTSGVGDIYYLGHVFRKDEVGRRHNPEFTMAEWYRIGFSLPQMIEETCQFLFLFLKKMPIEILTYREAFLRFLKINYTDISLEELKKLVPEQNIDSWSRTTLIHYLLSHHIEPHLGKNCLTVLTDYPPNEAALAHVKKSQGELVAERFEIYFEGVELSNGYHELNDGSELKRRFEMENNERVASGKEPYLLDEEFFSILKKLPSCCGVSVGFDRAFMLQQKKKSLSEVLPYFHF